MKTKIFLILRLFISVGLVAFLIWNMRGHFSDIAGTLVKTNPSLLTLAILLFLLNAIIVSIRLQFVFVGEGLKIPFGSVMQLSFVGFFFNNFMPTAVGGDIVKAYYAYRNTKETTKSFVAVFMDRFIGLFTFVFIAALVMLGSWRAVDIAIKKVVSVFVLFGIILFLITLNRRVAKFILNLLSKFRLMNLGERISKVYRTIHEYRNKKHVIFWVAVISVVAQSTYFLVVYLLAKSLGFDILLRTVFLVMAIVSVISMLPSLGGLGLREGAIVAFFGPVIGDEGAFAVSILLLASLLFLSLVGAIIYISAPQFRMKKTKAVEEFDRFAQKVENQI